MVDENEENQFDENDEWVSKSQRKREMQYRQSIGEKLMALKDSQREELNLPEDLISALDEAKRIKKNEALRRHKNYIGKLMRDIDLSPIETYFERTESSHDLNTRAFHELEDLRERLITGDNKTIGEAIEKIPNIDRQKLRQLVRNAQKERKANDANNTSDNKQGRALFRFIRDSSED